MISFGVLDNSARFITSLLALTMFAVSCKPSGFGHVDTKKDPISGAYYMLFSDGPCSIYFGDPGWFVYRVEKELGSAPPILPCGGVIGDTLKQDLPDGVSYLFSNYSESGTDIDDAKLEIVDHNYLIFYRGGYKYSLYDILNQKVIVNYWSPWGKYKTETGKQMEAEIEAFVK